MSVEFINNPYDGIIEAVTNLYGEIDCKVQYNPAIESEMNGSHGCTIYGENGIIYIDISTNIPFIQTVEVLAHELAHLVRSKVNSENEDSEGHDKYWDIIFDNIFNEYNRIAQEKEKAMINN
jgi:hypothetical protein